MGTEDIHRSRLGILGGSFDPVHEGHLAIARAVRDRLRLGRFLFVPNRLPPHKGVRASAEHRYRMVQIAVEGESGFQVSDREIRREGTSYTVETLREIRSEEGEGCQLYFAIGADTLPELPTWREFPEIARLARIVVVGRPGHPLDAAVALSGTVPDGIVREIEAHAIPLELREVSSTEVRERIRQGLSLDGWIPPGVATYIEEHQLYREAGES